MEGSIFSPGRAQQIGAPFPDILLHVSPQSAQISSIIHIV
jgi:hypothetical protein